MTPALSMSASFELDTPPSVNAMFRNVPGIGRVKSGTYKAWIGGQLKSLLAQRARPIQTPATVTILLPGKMRGDADNRIKAILDLLVKAKVIPDDSKKFVHLVSAGFHNGCRALVTVTSIEVSA